MNPSRKLGIVVMTAFAMVCTAAVPMATGVPTINGDWTVDLRTVCAVGGVVCGGTWWLSRKFTLVEERLREADERFARLETLIQGMGSAQNVEEARKACLEHRKGH